MSILLPALRILDNHRFDAKYADLKARRAARTDEQRIVEAGPMMLAINAKQEAPVLIPKALLKEKELIKRNKKRLEGAIRAEEKAYRKAVREAEKEGRNPAEVPKPKSMLPKEEGDSDGEESDREADNAGGGEPIEADAAEAEEAAVAEVAEPTAEEEAAAAAAAQEKKKEKRRKKREAATLEAEGGEDADPSLAGEKGRKKAKKEHKDRDRKDEALTEEEIAKRVEQRAADILSGKVTEPEINRARPKKDKAAAAAAIAVAAAADATGPSGEAAPDAPRHKKRGRDSKKHPELAPAPRKEREPSPPRPKKKKGGALADLRGDPSAPVEPKPVAEVSPLAEGAVEGAEGEDKAPAKESKAKTSVLKVVEVKRKKGSEAPVVDVSSLLGLGGGANEAEPAVGGGGWD